MKFEHLYNLFLIIYLFAFVFYGGDAEQILHFSITKHNICLETNKLNVIRTFPKISVPDCISQCKNRHECKAINFHRRTNICELISSDSENQIINNGRTGPCVLVLKSNIYEEQTCGCVSGDVCEDNKCVTKECSFKEQPENVDIVGNINTLGADILYTCVPGYINEGQDGAECNPTGIWSQQPSCVITCGTPSSVTGATRSFTSTVLNSVVTYFCKIGYTHTGGDLQRVCGSDGKWNGNLPICTVDCGTPSSVAGATRSFTSTVLNSVVMYSCQTGYTHTGGDLQRVCSSDGNWGGGLPTCTLDCGTPSSVTDAIRSYTNTFLNSVVTYSCKTGYTHTGGDLQRVCGPDGNWGGVLPTCSVDCGTPYSLTGATRSFTSTVLNSVVTYSCQTGYTHTGGDLQRVCGSDGNWGGILPICTVDCGTPYSVTSATRSFSSTVLNSVVTYSCQTSYTHTSGDLQRVCDSNGNWDGILPTCTIDCGLPTSVTGAYRSYSTTVLKSVVTYACKTGYTHTGGDLQHVCGSNGNWGGVLPTCTVDCPGLPVVPNSNVSPGGLTQGSQRTFTSTSGNYFATGVTSIVTICLSGGVWSNMDVICPRDSDVESCPGCGILRDCEDVYTLGLKTTGTYLIFPTGNTGISVRCDMDTASGGWTIIQRRISSSDFYKTWTEYKNGFGDVVTNYWLGNDNIATLTDSGSYKIRFDLYKQNNLHKYAEYSTFKTADESLKYRLTVSGYSGTAGDSLAIHNGEKFTTKDADNDPAAGTNCAVLYTGAWWYSGCHDSNLNGMYGSSESGKGLIWFTVTGLTNSLSKTEMKIKRK